MTRQPAAGPFAVLGLEARADLTDDEVHAAWRRVASASHPDREDGGDPERFAQAAAAYTALRTRFGRGEVLADLQALPAPARPSGQRDVQALSAGRRLWTRVRQGRPARLALRCAAAVAAGTAAVTAAGPHPAAPALVTGVATWLALTARHDLAPPDQQ
jgi:curved DNA-binding protein CbpA